MARIVLPIKLITLCLIGHTLYVNFAALMEILGPVAASAVLGLCDLTDTGQSWLFNLDYTLVTSETCDLLPQAPHYWEIPGEPVVTSSAGLDLARRLAWCDFAEIAAWLSVAVSMGAAIRITDRGVTPGYVMTVLSWLKFGLYALILALGIYWAYCSAFTGPIMGTVCTYGMSSCGSLASCSWRSILMVGETRLIMRWHTISRVEPN